MFRWFVLFLFLFLFCCFFCFLFLILHFSRHYRGVLGVLAPLDEGIPWGGGRGVKPADDDNDDDDNDDEEADVSLLPPRGDIFSLAEESSTKVYPNTPACGTKKN